MVLQAIDVDRQQAPLVDDRARDFVSDPRPSPGLGADQDADHGSVGHAAAIRFSKTFRVLALHRLPQAAIEELTLSSRPGR